MRPGQKKLNKKQMKAMTCLPCKYVRWKEKQFEKLKKPRHHNKTMLAMNNSTDIEYYNLSFLPFQLAEFASES